ncbi:MAG TPA: hypothetical protein VKB62_09855 [Streptosporangiaceae bacterium]|nr:hypothetical protein [Streptosporangiaceae bacterium]
MNADQVAALRALLAPTGWLDRTSSFARALRRSARAPNGLLVVGPAADEPWHMTAHLADESRLAGIPELAPTLIRWKPEPGAPAHLSVGVDRLRAATRAETLLVVSGQLAPAELLERVHDVRRAGATVFALDQDDPELDGLAHESLPVHPGAAPMSFDAAQHLVSSSVAEDGDTVGLRLAARRLADDPAYRHAIPAEGGKASLRTRLARLLDAVSGPQSD